mmetsp:Transcript_111285/g.287726  ORF Transcript_111285/g.287726 Transcript_111285/m.287726 type:complete len:158 (-) Transcript_111285:74-547(-)
MTPARRRRSERPRGTLRAQWPTILLPLAAASAALASSSAALTAFAGASGAGSGGFLAGRPGVAQDRRLIVLQSAADADGGCGDQCLVAIDECLEEGCSTEAVEKLLARVKAEEKQFEAGLAALRNLRAGLERTVSADGGKESEPLEVFLKRAKNLFR